MDALKYANHPLVFYARQDEDFAVAHPAGAGNLHDLAGHFFHEARMRLLSTTARDDLPDDPHELAKLASLLGYASADNLLFDCQYYTRENRKYFERLMR